MKHFSARRIAGLCLFWGLRALAPATAQQLGGRTVFPFLDLPTGAQQAALGGMNVSDRNDDPTMLFGNPALLNADMDGRLALSYVAYVADIKQSTAAYVFNTEKSGRLGVGITYLNYGSFESYDAAGNSLGTFRRERVHAGRDGLLHQGKFTFGATTKLAVSSIAGNRSLAGVADAGVVYKHPTQDFTAGLAVKNAGFQFSPYPGTAPRPPAARRAAGRHRQARAHAAALLAHGPPPAAVGHSVPRPQPAAPSTPTATRKKPTAASATTWPGTSRSAPRWCWARACSSGPATTTCSAASYASTTPAAAPASASV